MFRKLYKLLHLTILRAWHREILNRAYDTTIKARILES